MAAHREFDSINDAGWVSETPERTGVLIQFPITPPAESNPINEVDLFTMGDHWERIKAPVKVADDISFDVLVQQEGIDPAEHAHDRFSHAHMLAENGGTHVVRNRYPSGFPSWDDQG